MNIVFTFRIFDQLALALKTECALKFFTVLNILFTFRIFEQLALALKTECALKFFTVLNILFTFRIFEQLALALKIEFALKFFKSGGAAAPPDPPPRTPMGKDTNNLTASKHVTICCLEQKATFLTTGGMYKRVSPKSHYR